MTAPLTAPSGPSIAGGGYTPPKPSSPSARWTKSHTFGVMVISAGICVAGWLVPADWRLRGWLLTLALFAVLFAVVGHGLTGRAWGGLIDDRNKMSLSRLQSVAWTAILFSAWLIAALINLKTNQAAPLSISIPEELWLVLGISATSLLGTPLLRSIKKDKQANTAEWATTERALARKGTQEVYAEGLIVENNEPRQAGVSDLFAGEEVGNAAVMDLAKLQMFFFTLILVFAYAVMLARLLGSGTAPIAAFPPLDESMVALFAISHAGYLANKAVPHSRTP